MKHTLFIVCGLPGSGKSTIANQLNGRVVSSDTVRKILYGDESIQGDGKKVFKVVESLVSEYLKSSNVIYDATSISPKTRKSIIKRFSYANCVAVWVNTPFEECLKRNNDRARVVPEEVIKRMNEHFIPPTLAEGFSQVLEIKSV